MARLLTAGAETLNAIGDDKSMEGSITTSGTVTVNTATVHAGSKSFKCDGGAGAVAAYVMYAFTGALNTTYYARAWVNLSANPAATRTIVWFLTGAAGSNIFSAVLQTDGTVQDSIGGISSGVITDGAWHCIELQVLVVTGTNDTGSLIVDGVTITSRTSAFGDTAPGAVRFGWAFNAGANQVIYVDDLALNDSTGGAQNSWAGLGKQVLLLPTADSAIGTGWTLGSGGTTNLWDAVNNIPPVGVADAGTTAQIRNATANASVHYDATMTTYTAAGIAAADTINLIDAMTWTAAPVTTSSKQGLVGVASNPAITTVALAAGGTAGAFWSGTAGGTYPTGWKLSHGTLTYAPSVTVGTAPVMRVTQTTSSTRIAMVCFMGMYVDYTPAVAGTDAPFPMTGGGYYGGFAALRKLWQGWSRRRLIFVPQM